MNNTTKQRLYMKIIACVAATAAFFALGSFAAQAADLSQTKEAMQKLAEIKDDTNLTPQEKEAMEIRVRKDILLTIIDVSRKQSQELKSRLETANLPKSESWNAVKDRLLSDVSASISFYYKTQSQLEQDNNLSLDGIKNISLALETQKSSQFDAATERASLALSAFNIGDILQLADERLAKISADVEKVYAQKITKNPSLRDMLDNSSSSLQESRRTDDKAKDIIFNLYGDQDATSAEHYRTNLENEIRTIKLKGMTKEEKASYDRARKQLDITDEDVRSYVQTLLASSIDGIRSAYGTFLKMSVNVRDYLK